MPQKLIIKNSLSPGDIVMLTAAVRDMHQCYPGRFITDVRTPYGPIWENNPYITPLSELDSDVRTIECHYPLIQQSNQRPYHFIHAFIAYLNEQLNLDIKPTAFRGDIHLSNQETSWFSQVHEIVGDDRPFWIVASGGKYDFTNKWWETCRYQEVIDYFRGKICFVQVGRLEDHHPPLEGVIDLRGRTGLRQLIRLVYHSQGVLCPVTALMHLAAAVPSKPNSPILRPCVVVAGGREPSQWEAYPHHQFIHTIGALPCCQTGGCWKSRTVPLGDGDEKDRPENLCVNVINKLPKCMDMITSTEVIQRIQIYFNGGIAQYLEPTLNENSKLTHVLFWDELTKDRNLTAVNAAEVTEVIIPSIPLYPESFRGRGIVICGGGVK
jgi:ADP-heptose:LPS heptosyltransferase